MIKLIINGFVYEQNSVQNVIQTGRRFGSKNIIFSDEAHFVLGGYVNKQNCLIWGTENPYEYIEKPTHKNESLFGADFEQKLQKS